MSKAFTKETDDQDDEPEKQDTLPKNLKNYVTVAGFNALQNELRHLLHEERPKIVETVRWAAGNGDRSENGDYIYGKKRLREIDRRVRYLKKQMNNAEVVDQALQKGLSKVFFGATVTYEEDGATHTVQLVGVDEANLSAGKISWFSPVAKALIKSEVGDVVTLETPQGTKTFKITGIEYK